MRASKRQVRKFAAKRARADHQNMISDQRVARDGQRDREAYEAERERLRQRLVDEAHRAAILEDKAHRDVRGRAGRRESGWETWEL